MPEETIVAVFDTAAHAEAAVRDLAAAGVPSSAITQHTQGGVTAGASTTAGAPREQGFWSSLFGGEPEHEHDTTVYDRSLQSGSTVVAVKAPSEHLTAVSDLLERHNPIDLEERAASYGATETATMRSTTAETAAATGVAGARATDGGAIQLAEEQLVVGKRAVNRGTARVRRYVVETPVQEQVTLRDEKVSIERRPVTDGRPVSDANFSEKVIEVRETGEEAVVAKTARVKEEVVLHKEASERTETVRDTVRREEVEITNTNDVASKTTPARNVPPTPAKPKI